MRSLSVAVVKAGIIEESTVQEFQRWGLPVQFVAETGVLKSAEEVVDHIREALEENELVKIHESDVDILKRYVANQQKGKLFVQKKGIDITFALSKLGEYVIPWRDESIYELMLDPETTLRYTNAEGQRIRVGFKNARELFFGDRKFFMVCEPIADENGE